MSNTELLDQILSDTEILIKWANEEANEHMYRMLLSTIELSQSCTLQALVPDIDIRTRGLLAVSVVTKKLADIYKRSYKATY